MKKIVVLSTVLPIVLIYFAVFATRINDCKAWGLIKSCVKSPSTTFKDEPKKIIETCDYVNSKLPNKGFNKCLFDLSSSVIYSQRFWGMSFGSLKKEIDRHIGFCITLPVDVSSRYDCVSGVYNGLNLAYLEPDNNLPYKKDDPFWLCDSQKEYDLKIRCTRALVASLYSLENENINRIVDLINALEDEKERRETLLTFFSSLVYQEIPKDQIYKLCLGFNPSERQLCLNGYATGLIEISPPGEEEESVVGFCVNESFSKPEIGNCLKRGFFDLQSFYPQEKESVCLKHIPFEFLEFCNFNGLDTET